ncbi:MAG: carboxypeptidase regulatory-like domain-containing protein [Bryobacteraceae bacterium]
MSFRNISGLCLSVCLLAVSAAAQTITGAIGGTVTDASGAVVPNVKVTATNVATNLIYNSQSNAAGIYNLLFLPIGDYNVSAESSGFKKLVLGPFKLETAQTARVDIKMEVGEVTQSVEIRDVAPILQTDTTATGDVITGTQAVAIPLKGRNFLSFTLMVPGSITPNPGSFDGPSRSFGGGRPYVNGNREQTNNFLLDGVDINESIDNLVAYNPNVDALAEIKVQTGNASAEFGNANGAIVNMTLKSGTNRYHGNLFEFLQNDNLNANGFFPNRVGQQKRTFQRNIFGATFGGPIVRDKHFFFIDYQGTRQRGSGPATASVAPAEFRTGNLSRFASPIRDPQAGGTPFAGNQIPQSRIVNPVARALFADQRLYPLPNNEALATGAIRVNGNYRASSGNFNDNDQADVKIDSRLSDKNMLSGRLSIARYRDATKSVALPIFIGGLADAPTTGGALTWTRTVSPTVVNEARLGYTRTKIENNSFDPTGLLGADGNSKLGIPGGQPITGASSVALGDGLSGVGGTAPSSDTVDNAYQYGDNLTWSKNRHLMKMGFQAIRFQQNRFYAGNNGLLGRFSYNGRYTGTAFADFLLNQLAAKGRGSLTGKWGHRHWRSAIFFQDDFKLRPNLTLNLGLRWEYTQPVYEVADRQSNVDLQTGRQLFAGKDGNSRSLYNAYWHQYMPRIGAAWTPGLFKNKLVVRTAYGITSYMEGTGANLRLPLNPPSFFESDITYDANAPGDIRLGFTDVRPQSALSGQVRAWNPDLRPAFIQQWNFSLEYQISNTFSVNTAYVGQAGAHLVDPREYNQPLADPGPVATWRTLDQRRRLYSVAPLITNISGTDSSSNMDYHSLQVSGRKRLSGGVEFITSYTLSRTLTDNLGYYGSGGVAAEGAYWQNAYDRRGDRGRAFFDALHNFTLGGSYELPVGQGRTLGKNMNRALDLIAGGWGIHYGVSGHSGFPITIQATDRSRQLVRGALRADRNGTFQAQNQSIDNWFGTSGAACLAAPSSCAYSQPAEGQFGTAGKNTEQAPKFGNVDLSIGKKFTVTESQYAEFRAEFYNLLNSTSFGPPGRSLASPATFGFITGAITGPRAVQFGLKYYF